MDTIDPGFLDDLDKNLGHLPILHRRPESYIPGEEPKNPEDRKRLYEFRRDGIVTFL